MKVFLEDISKQWPSDKLMQHRKRVHMFDRNGYGFALKKKRPIVKESRK